jgi:integrase
LRISEAEELRRRDVRLAEGKIHVRGTKTDNADRVVDLLPVLHDELSVYFAADPDADANDRVFRTSKGGRIGSTNVRRRVLAPAIEAADKALRAAGDEPFPKGITPHSLRRTLASVLVALRKDLAYVQKQMGHATPQFTLGVYAQMMKASEEDRRRLRLLVEGRPLDADDAADDSGGRGKTTPKGQMPQIADLDGERPSYEKTPPERGFRRSG